MKIDLIILLAFIIYFVTLGVLVLVVFDIQSRVIIYVLGNIIGALGGIPLFEYLRAENDDFM